MHFNMVRNCVSVDSDSYCSVLYSTVQKAVVYEETFTELPDPRELICM
jgi:hypothetical protein